MVMLPCRRGFWPEGEGTGTRVDNPGNGVSRWAVSVMAAVSVAVCWLTFAAVWAVTANYNATRAPAGRQRSWYGTGILPVVAISVVIRLAGPRADWQSDLLRAVGQVPRRSPAGRA